MVASAAVSVVAEREDGAGAVGLGGGEGDLSSRSAAADECLRGDREARSPLAGSESWRAEADMERERARPLCEDRICSRDPDLARRLFLLGERERDSRRGEGLEDHREPLSSDRYFSNRLLRR